MTNEIRIGTMFIEDGTFMPEAIEFASGRYPAGWRSMTKPSIAELGKDRSSAGWMDVLLHGWRRACQWLRLQCGITDETRVGQSDRDCQSGEL